MISGVTARFSTHAELQQVQYEMQQIARDGEAVVWTCICFQLEEFERKHSAMGFGSATLAVQQAVERTQTNIDWLQHNKQEVLDWFLSQTRDR